MNSDQRVFEIFLRMQNGEEFTREQLESEYGKSRRTIYQDLQEIRETLSEVTHSGQELIKTDDGKYKLSKSDALNEKYVFVLTKILMSSRALNKEETGDILAELFDTLSSKAKMGLRRSLFGELEHYHSISNDANKINLLYRLETAIQENQKIEFDYHSEEDVGRLGADKVDWSVKCVPLAIFFDNYYFYLVAKNGEKREIYHVKGISDLKNFYPTLPYPTLPYPTLPLQH